MNMTFRILLKQEITWGVLVFYEETRIIFIKPNMMVSVDNKTLSGFQYIITPVVAAYPMK